VRLLVLSAVALQVVLPPILLFWLWRRTPSTRVEWLAGVAVVVSTIAVLSLVLPWSAVPWYVRHVHAVAALGVAVASWMQARRVGWFQACDRRRWATFTTHGVLALLLSAVLVRVALGMAVPQGPRIDLACPFPSGVYLVVNGGNSRLLNSHLETLEPIARYAPWRGQARLAACPSIVGPFLATLLVMPHTELNAQVIALAPAATSPGGPTDPAELEAFMDGLMTAHLTEKGIAGATVAVVGNNEILLLEGYGFADVAARTPVDPERTLFRIASVTKLFTATALS
jgi:hypothetical protein